jgi:hypothetical protein
VSNEADAAALRMAFNCAVETYPQHLAKFIGKEAEAAFRAWWGQLYEAVRDHTAGLSLIAKLATLESENAELRAVVDALPKAPSETYTCGCAAVLGEPKLKLFCSVHYKPFPFDPAAYPHLAPSTSSS